MLQYLGCLKSDYRNALDNFGPTNMTTQIRQINSLKNKTGLPGLGQKKPFNFNILKTMENHVSVVRNFTKCQTPMAVMINSFKFQGKKQQVYPHLIRKLKNGEYFTIDFMKPTLP